MLQKGAFCNTFELFKLPFVIKIFVLSIFEWPLKTGSTVYNLIRRPEFIEKSELMC